MAVLDEFYTFSRKYLVKTWALRRRQESIYVLDIFLKIYLIFPLQFRQPQLNSKTTAIMFPHDFFEFQFNLTPAVKVE